MLAYLLAALVVVIAAAIAFGIGALLHMQGLTYLLFVALLLIIGIGAAVLIIVMHLRAKKQSTLEGEGAPSESKAELDLLLNDANRKLRESQQGAKSLESIPLIYILGDAASAKTTTVLQSGLEPELLAGSVSQASTQTPTPILNLWYTRLAALLEIGETVRQSNPLLARLIHRTRATAYRSAFGAGAPPRAVIVCLSAEQLLQTAGGDSLLSSARATGTQLREISRILGMPVAVYLIVTKLDRVPYFDEYVRNLSDDEVRQALGSTLGRIDSSAGTYADQASRIISASIDSLVFKLGGFRIEVLDRENSAANVSPVYEFPREFGKLRKNLNQYLVELCKPSQLSANPYLRGYYFTGVRARIVERAAAAPVMAEVAVAKDAGATQFLNLSALRAKADQPAAPVVTSSRVPQWTFLARLLPEVILGDKSALSPTRQSAPARLFRRLLFGTLGFIFALATFLVLVSYFNNAALERRIHEDAQALPAANADAIVPPTLTQLQKLDDLRQVIVLLDDQQKNGAPLSYRFGLYQGDHLREGALHTYFDRFRPLILNQIQNGLVQHMSSLPDAAQGNSNDMTVYLASYNPLKAYLITTDHPEKSQPAFQTPILAQYWNVGQTDPGQLQLVQKQIDFYGDELLRHPPYSIDPDAVVVKHTRAYLNTFLAAARVYQSMLDGADKKNPQGIDFNRQYPNSFVADSHVIRGAFTRDGFSFMQEALQHPERYANGEKWVLGDQLGTSLDASTLAKDLSAEYSSEYLKEWHQFLVSAHVAPCGGLKEAPKELQALSGATSPILALFYVVSHNTAVADQQIKNVFQPAQVVVDPNATDRFIGVGNNKDYINSLSALGLAMEGATAQNPSGPDAAAFSQQLSQPIQTAKAAVQQLSNSFNIDRDTHTQDLVTNLLNQPIECVVRSQPSPGAAANGAGDKICGAINSLRGKFPFSISSQTQASLSEVDNVLAPDTGVLWVNYNGILKQYLVPAGGQANASYVQAPNAPQPPSPGFVSYFNHAAHISNTLYAPGQKAPSFTFNLRFLPGNGVKSATLVVDGQRIPSGATSQQFTWNGKTAQSTSLLYDNKEAISFQGPWSLFQMIRTAAPHITRSGSGYRLEYPIDTSTTIAGHKIGGSSGAPNIVSFELSGPGADLLVGDGFAVPACVKAVAK